MLFLFFCWILWLKRGVVPFDRLLVFETDGFRLVRYGSWGPIYEGNPIYWSKRLVVDFTLPRPFIFLRIGRICIQDSGRLQMHGPSLVPSSKGPWWPNSTKKGGHSTIVWRTHIANILKPPTLKHENHLNVLPPSHLLAALLGRPRREKVGPGQWDQARILPVCFAYNKLVLLSRLSHNAAGFV